jgi:hypothetical protein
VKEVAIEVDGDHARALMKEIEGEDIDQDQDPDLDQGIVIIEQGIDQEAETGGEDNQGSEMRRVFYSLFSL